MAKQDPYGIRHRPFPKELNTPRKDYSVVLPKIPEDASLEELEKQFPDGIPVFYQAGFSIEQFEEDRRAEDLRLLPALMKHYRIKSDDPTEDARALLELVLAMAREFVPSFQFESASKKRGRPVNLLERVSFVGMVEHARSEVGAEDPTRLHPTIEDGLGWLAWRRLIGDETEEGETEEDEDEISEPIDKLLKRHKDAMRSLRKELGIGNREIRKLCKEYMATKIPWGGNSEDI